MGQMRRWRNGIIRKKAERQHGSGKAGVAALREHRGANKASGKARQSGWRGRWPQWLKDFIFGKEVAA